MARRANVRTRRSKGRKRPRTRVRTRRPRRRAAAPARYIRKRRPNPRGFLDQPVVRYGGAFLAGAAGGAYVNAANSLEMVRERLPEGMAGWKDSTIGALLLGALSWFFLKGKNRMYGIAAAFGMAAPAVLDKASEQYAIEGESKALAQAGRRYIAHRRPTAARAVRSAEHLQTANVLK